MRVRRTGRERPQRRMAMRTIRPRLAWPAAVLLGSVLGLGLRLLLFWLAILTVRSVAELGGNLLPLLPAADPVYSHAAVRSLADVQLAGLAVGGPLGRELHALWPGLIVDPTRAHVALLRLAVKPGSALMARLVAAGLAHAALLGIGLAIVRRAWLTRSMSLILVGMAVQAQVAVGILDAPPSLRELEATGMSFAANALAPWLWQRGQALTDTLTAVPRPTLAAILVSLALLLAYVPGSLLVLLKARARMLTLSTALVIVLTSAACAGVLQPDVTASAGAGASLVSIPADQPPPENLQAPVDFAPANPSPARAFVADRWFDEPISTSSSGPPTLVNSATSGASRRLLCWAMASSTSQDRLRPGKSG